MLLLMYHQKLHHWFYLCDKLDIWSVHSVHSTAYNHQRLCLSSKGDFTDGIIFLGMKVIFFCIIWCLGYFFTSSRDLAPFPPFVPYSWHQNLCSSLANPTSLNQINTILLSQGKNKYGTVSMWNLKWAHFTSTVTPAFVLWSHLVNIPCVYCFLSNLFIPDIEYRYLTWNVRNHMQFNLYCIYNSVFKLMHSSLDVAKDMTTSSTTATTVVPHSYCIEE